MDVARPFRVGNGAGLKPRATRKESDASHPEAESLRSRPRDKKHDQARGGGAPTRIKKKMTMTLIRLSFVALFVVAVAAQGDSSRDALLAAIQRGSVGEVDRLLGS